MDENAPPGYLSPFGLLAGIRNMLPGGGKDQQAQESESPNRPVLKDANSSEGPKPKNLLNVAQAAEGSTPPSPASLSGNCSLVSSPGQGERRSVASDTSFVSAVSAISRAEKLDSDNDDSCFETSYVSAAESSGNLSFLGDQFSKLVLNSPAPHSNLLNGSSEKPNVKPFNSWPGVELSADETISLDNSPANGLSDKEDHLDPLEERNFTLADQTCSSSNHSDLDVTIEDVQGNNAVNQTQILNETSQSSTAQSQEEERNLILPDQACSSSNHSDLDATIEEVQENNAVNQTQILNETSPSSTDQYQEEERNLILPDQACSSSNHSNLDATFEEVQENDAVNQTQILSEISPSSTAQYQEVSSQVVPGSTENVNVTFDSVPVGAEAYSIQNETVNTEDLNNSEWRDLVNETQVLSQEISSQVVIDSTENVNVTFDSVPVGAEEYSNQNETVNTEDLNNSERRDLVNETQVLSQEDSPQAEGETPGEHNDFLSDNHVNSNPSQFPDEIPLPIRKPRTFEEILAAELAAQSDPEQAVPSFSASPRKLDAPAAKIISEDTPPLESECESEPVLDSAPTELELESESDADTGLNNFESPIQSQEDICQAEGESPPDNNDAVSDNQDISHPTKFDDEIPLPSRKPRTFEEILAAELAAQSDPEQAVPSFSASPRKLDESFAKIISADTSPLESECEPELVLDSAPTELDLESDADSGLDSLIKRCKQQERDLEEENFQSVSEEASQISSCYINESERTCSTASEDLESPDCANQTVIEITSDGSPMNSKVAPDVIKTQVSGLLGDSTEGENFEEEFESGDAFKDPSAFDFLSLHGCSRSARDLRKESLYMKFDPLVGSFSSDSYRVDNSIMHPENSSEPQAAATGGEEQAINTSVKLLSLSPSASKKEAEDAAQDATLITPLKTPYKSTPVKTPAHIMLNETLESIGSRGTLVKQEDLIKKLQEHQAVLEEQDKAYQERISELEQRLQEMDIRRAEDVKERDKELQEKVQSLGELNVIMKEYEKTISRLVAEKSQEKAALEEKQVELVKDRDQAQQHLNNMEIAFSDIHTKYERLKSVVTALKKNEETLNAALAEKQENFDKMQNMYDMLKSHAVSKLEKANQDLESIKQKHQQENSKLKAMVKKLEVKTKSLEEALEQKVKENQALTAICDELINKVGE